MNLIETIQHIVDSVDFATAAVIWGAALIGTTFAVIVDVKS